MNPYLFTFLFLLVFASCTNKPGNTDEERLRTENFRLRQQVDSLNNLISKSVKQEGDTVLLLPDEGEKSSKGSFAGKHNLTLQWISWDNPGSVTIVPAENGWYTISGQQVKGDNYLKINGRIKPLSPQELEFDGEIETRVSSINSGEPCLKTGKKVFKATGDRQYWRLQDMINCEGSTTDYIDIYF